MKKNKGISWQRPALDRGRAFPIGTVTRRCRLVRTNLPGVKPLPLDLQVLPQRLKRLPRHVGCPSCPLGGPAAAAAYLLRDKPLHQFDQMEGFDTEPKKWRVVLFDKVAYTDNFAWAWAWKTAANMKGLPAEVEKCEHEQQEPRKTTCDSAETAETGEGTSASHRGIISGETEPVPSDV